MQIGKPSSCDDGQEQPLELLFACHERVRRFAGLSARLAEHVDERGADAEAQQAASNVLRYFELALPNHHADEEVDIFPALQALDDARVNAAIAALLDQHRALDTAWRDVQPWLADVAAGHARPAPPTLRDFVAGYLAHVDREEREVFPALARLPKPTVLEIAEAMRARRGG